MNLLKFLKNSISSEFLRSFRPKCKICKDFPASNKIFFCTNVLLEFRVTECKEYHEWLSNKVITVLALQSACCLRKTLQHMCECIRPHVMVKIEIDVASVDTRDFWSRDNKTRDKRQYLSRLVVHKLKTDKVGWTKIKYFYRNKVT